MRRNREIKPVNNAKHLAILLIVFGLLLGGIYLATERLVLQKVVLALLMPVGFAWMMMLMMTYFLFVNGKRGFGLIVLLFAMLFSFSGNEYVSRIISRSLEEPFFEFDIDKSPKYDYVVLLGGGTMYTLNEKSQLGGSGDRIMVAAQMYHQGKAKKIVCTGSHIKSFSAIDIPSPGEQAFQILTKAGVPSDAIEFSEGRTTQEEFNNLREFFKNKDVKVGVISSAWHLPRVLRLAEKQNLKVDPIPSNFISSYPRFTIQSLIPSSGAMHDNSKMLKEYLAKALGQ